MLKIEELIIPRTATVLETMKKLDETGQRILFIAPEGRLEAVVTDGDIRKFFLRGGTLEAPVAEAANFRPISLPVSGAGPGPNCSATASTRCRSWTGGASSPTSFLPAAWMWTTASGWTSRWS